MAAAFGLSLVACHATPECVDSVIPAGKNISDSTMSAVRTARRSIDLLLRHLGSWGPSLCYALGAIKMTMCKSNNDPLSCKNLVTSNCALYHQRATHAIECAGIRLAELLACGRKYWNNPSTIPGHYGQVLQLASLAETCTNKYRACQKRSNTITSGRNTKCN